LGNYAEREDGERIYMLHESVEIVAATIRKLRSI
jgi:hypothetical protein